MNITDEQKLYNLVDDLSRTYFKKSFMHSVRFNSRLRTTGGRYLPSSKVIELNPKYARELEEELTGIIKHELCHYHLHIEGKGYRHGDADFKSLLKETGSPRHCNPLPSMQEQHQYIYTCLQCGHLYERRRRVNVKKYRCGKCRGQLTKVQGDV